VLSYGAAANSRLIRSQSHFRHRKHSSVISEQNCTLWTIIPNIWHNRKNRKRPSTACCILGDGRERSEAVQATDHRPSAAQTMLNKKSGSGYDSMPPGMHFSKRVSHRSACCDGVNRCLCDSQQPGQQVTRSAPTSTPRPLRPIMRTVALAMRFMLSLPYTASWRECKSSSMLTPFSESTCIELSSILATLDCFPLERSSAERFNMCLPNLLLPCSFSNHQPLRIQRR
jgi:hypothetical protein